MNRPGLALLLALACAAPAAPARAGDPPAADGISPADRRKVAAWIDDLDHAEYARREAATKALRDFGGRALPFLEEAEAGATEEARTRIRLLALVLRAGRETESGEGWFTLKGDPGRTGSRGDAPGALPSVGASRDVGGIRRDLLRGPDAPLACAEGVLAAVHGDRLSVLEAKDLAPRWGAGLGSAAVASPVVSRGIVYASTARGLRAFRLADGSEAWSRPAAYGVGGAPLVAGGTLYAGLAGEAIVALDAATGETRWEHRCPADRGAPVVAAGRVIVGLSTGEVVALDAATGKPAWRLAVDGGMSFAPAVVGPSVVVGDGGRRLRSVDAATGEVLWTRSVKGRFAGDGPAASARAVVVSLDNTEIEAYDPATGNRLWNRWMGTLHLSSPALAGGLVLVGSRTRLVALDARSGDDAWSLDLDGAVACPLVSGGTVYALAGARLVALR